LSTLKTKHCKKQTDPENWVHDFAAELLLPDFFKALTGSNLHRKTRLLLDDFSALCDEWQRQVSPSHPIHCHRGCGFCCDLLNWTSLTEAALLIPTLNTTELHHFQRLDGLLLTMSEGMEPDDLFEAYRLQSGFCPLLCKDRSCRLHPLRPLSCRSVFSLFPPFLCRAELPGRYGTARLSALIERHPSVEYHQTPYAQTPILWRDQTAQGLQQLMAQSLGWAIEGTLPTMISLTVKIGRSSTRATALANEGLAPWLEDRIKCDLVTAQRG
jgi:Fe-S-cluster containining protein